MLVIRRRISLRDEAGFTLPELLMGMVIGMVVLFAAFTLLDTTIGVAARVDRSTDALSRGRTAMDLIVRDLRSQVCLPSSDPDNRPNQASLIAGSDNSVDVYTDLGDGTASRPPQRRTITFDPTARTIVEQIYTPSGTAGNYVFDQAPLTRTLLTNVDKDDTTPVFSFYAFDGSTPRQPVTAVASASGIAAADLDDVVRIVVRFRVARTGGTTASSGASVLTDEVYRTNVDPNAATPAPECR
jgi:type II secretory pathway pseudopilin PulG